MFTKPNSAFLLGGSLSPLIKVSDIRLCDSEHGDSASKSQDLNGVDKLINNKYIFWKKSCLFGR